MYANAIRDELPDAVAVLDAFHVVKLGTQVVDEVRRRVQRATQGRRGHKDDPLYEIRGLLRLRSEHLSDPQIATLDACLLAGDPSWEVTLAWHCSQQVRLMYQAERPAQGKASRPRPSDRSDGPQQCWHQRSEPHHLNDPTPGRQLLHLRALTPQDRACSIRKAFLPKNS